MAEKLILSPRQVMMVLDKAAKEFDHFPSLAQIKQLSESLQKDMSPRTAIQYESTEKHPWPNKLIGLLMGFDDPRGVSSFGLKSLRLNMDEAKYLYERWKERKWTDPWALEIMEKADLSIDDLLRGAK